MCGINVVGGGGGFTSSAKLFFFLKVLTLLGSYKKAYFCSKIEYTQIAV